MPVARARTVPLRRPTFQRGWRRLRVLFAGLAFPALVAAGLGAPATSLSLFGQTGATAGSETGRSVLLLTNGRLVEGRITQSASGYVVDKANGSMLIPFEQVRLQAHDAHDAYIKLRASLPVSTPENRVELARWCLLQQLYDDSRQELKYALELDPDYQPARDMLVRLEDVLRPRKPAEEPPPASREATEYAPPEATSLAGLSRESALEFTTRIQPILANKCGNAGCHGAASRNGFRLSHISSGRGASRILTERNLGATLPWIDLHDPENSPLLKTPQGNHGRGGSAVFFGSAGTDQLQTLRDWVERVAEERGGKAKSNEVAVESPAQSPRFPARPGDAAGTPAFPGARAGEFKGTDVAPAAGTVPNVSAAAFQQSASQERDPLLDRVLEEERRDAFDPAEFNRRFRSGADSP